MRTIPEIAENINTLRRSLGMPFRDHRRLTKDAVISAEEKYLKLSADWGVERNKLKNLENYQGSLSLMTAREVATSYNIRLDDAKAFLAFISSEL